MGIVRDFLLKKVKNDVFVQIGTYDGNDEFRELVIELKPSTILLVEPNKDMIPIIAMNYNNISGVYIENVAIVASKEQEGILYLPRTDNNGKADNGIYYGASKFSLNPLNDWGSKDDMQKINVATMTIESLFKRHAIKYVDYLCLETEGYDGEIIKSMDLWNIPVHICQYENWDFDSTMFARHNENWDNLGSKAMECIEGIFSAMGYEQYKDGANKIVVTNREEAWKEQA